MSIAGTEAGTLLSCLMDKEWAILAPIFRETQSSLTSLISSSMSVILCGRGSEEPARDNLRDKIWFTVSSPTQAFWELHQVNGHPFDHRPMSPLPRWLQCTVQFHKRLQIEEFPEIITFRTAPYNYQEPSNERIFICRWLQWIICYTTEATEEWLY